jgi:hypothetical protein
MAVKVEAGAMAARMAGTRQNRGPRDPAMACSYLGWPTVADWEAG